MIKAEFYFKKNNIVKFNDFSFEKLLINNSNINIFKDDLVIITETNISNKIFKDIELYDGEIYE